MRTVMAKVRHAGHAMALVFVTMALLGAVSSVGYAAGPWLVSSAGSDANDCLTPSTACATVGGALAKPGFVAGDTIRLATGTYTGIGNAVVFLNKNATLTGGWDPGFTVQAGVSTLDGQGVRRGLEVSVGGFTATIERLVIQSGAGVGLSGGGILNNGTLTVKQSTIQNNVAGGVRNLGVLVVENSTISNNTNNSGGGGLVNDGTATVTNTTISGNRTTSEGGGIENSSFSPFGISLQLRNSTVTGNHADFRGAGIAVEFNTSAVLRNTIVAGNENSFGSRFGAIDCFRDFQATIASEGYNLTGFSCDYASGVGDVVTFEPGLGPLQDNGGPTPTHALLPGSPAIDAGNPVPPESGGTACEATDQRGVERPQGTACDIGAFEAAGPLFLHGNGGPANPVVLFLDANAPTGSTAKYRDSAAVSASGGNPWKAVGTWSAAPSLTSGSLLTLGDVHVWLGLKNSDDQGTRFDLRVEVLKDGTNLVAAGEVQCITGVTRDPAKAQEVAVTLAPFDPVSFDGSGNVLGLRILTRVGSGTGCGGHSNAIGLRLYFDSVSRNARVEAVEFE